MSNLQARLAAPRVRPSPQAVKARRREIAVRWRSRRTRIDVDKMLAGIRRREIETLIRYRHGTLPDTDDCSTYLRLWAWHNLRSRRQELELQAMCCRLGGNVPEREILETVRYVQRRELRRFAPDTLGRHLRLTDLERTTLCITTIEAHDVTARERKEIRALKKAQRQRQRRREKGARPRTQYEASSLSKLKPWEQANMSRSTWYARQKSGQKRPAKMDLDKCEAKHLTSVVQGLTPVQTDTPMPGQQQADSRGGHGPLPTSALSYEHLPVEIRLRCLCLGPD
jgi:hypothetical protein